MSEWSKEPGLGPGMFACVGSNPSINSYMTNVKEPVCTTTVGYINFFSSNLLMGFKPLLSFRGTTIARAFLLNAILIGITTAFTIEVRRTVNESQYTKDFPDIPHKVLATAFASTLIGLTAYIFLRILFGTGGGMLAPTKPYPSFF